jgi:hypothetical protein
MAFSVATVGTGFLLAWIYAATGSHLPLFAVGAVGGIAALIVGRK